MRGRPTRDLVLARLFQLREPITTEQLALDIRTGADTVAATLSRLRASGEVVRFGAGTGRRTKTLWILKRRPT